jgi:hypothetical protein
MNCSRSARDAGRRTSAKDGDACGSIRPTGARACAARFMPLALSNFVQSVGRAAFSSAAVRAINCNSERQNPVLGFACAPGFICGVSNIDVLENKASRAIRECPSFAERVAIERKQLRTCIEADIDRVHPNAEWQLGSPRTRSRLGFYRSSYDTSTVLRITVIIEETSENPWSVISDSNRDWFKCPVRAEHLAIRNTLSAG